MQSQTFTLSGLAVELGIDRRTVAKMLDDLPASEKEPDGTRRWKLRAVLAHIEQRKAMPDVGQSANIEARVEMHTWLCHQLLPAIIGSKTFVTTLTGRLRAELGLSKVQVARAYMFVLLALVAELENSGIYCGLDLPPIAQKICEEGFDKFVAVHWPDA